MEELKKEIRKEVENEEKIKAQGLSVGYGKKLLISDINFTVEPGKILTLIGPNGSGKSTVLKTLTGQLTKLGGEVSICGKSIENLKENEMAKSISMVMTERIKPELMTCRDVIATGRYPYTGHLGILSKEDWEKVDDAIELMQAGDVADMDFNCISDGQRQRVMLARAFCQDTDIIILDEPTSFLDMRYKIELMNKIYYLAREKQKTIIMSLHELDLAQQISDTILCVDGEQVTKIGTPEEIFTGTFIQDLYGVPKDAFDPATGRVFVRDGGFSR